MNVGGFVDVFHLSVSEMVDSVYRVNWLRAKACYDRWEEELTMVVHEMEWTTLWFKHEEESWKRRAEMSEEEGNLGKSAYGWKQVEMWKEFRKEAVKAFRGKAISLADADV